MNPSRKLSVVVVGAGLTGVCAAKYALEEGLDVTCFEQDDQIGGVWYYTDNPRQNQGAASYEGLRANDCGEMLSYSDYPMPEDYEFIVTCKQYQQYLKDYAAYFGVTERIQFNTTVKKIKPARDYSQTGRWEVHTQRKGASNVTVQEFDKVMMAIGPWKDPQIPSIQGMQNFKGKTIHVAEFRKRNIFDGKRVVVYGDGVFASEVAFISGERANKTYLCVKNGYLLFSRVAPGPTTFFLSATRHLMLDHTLDQVDQIFKPLALANLDVEKYGMEPRHPLFQGGKLGATDNLPEHVESGKVVPKRDLMRFTETGVVFGDGTEVKDVDLVVFCTGFLINLDMLEIPGLKDEKVRANLDLYQWMFPVDLPHHSLALLNVVPGYESLSLNAELLSRLALRVFQGKHKLPEKAVMKEWLSKKRNFIKKTLKDKFYMPPVLHSEEIAKELGVAPSFWRLFWRNPVLAHNVHYGPNHPVVYRLVGSGALKNPAKHYYEAYKRAYRRSPTPPVPWGIHHYALAALILGGTSAAVWMLLGKPNFVKALANLKNKML